MWSSVLDWESLVAQLNPAIYMKYHLITRLFIFLNFGVFMFFIFLRVSYSGHVVSGIMTSISSSCRFK